MIISSASGGGEIVTRGEETRFYDDVGCLAADVAAGRKADAVFVRVGTDGWSEAGAASYARPRDAATPMGSGIVAFRTADEARSADRDRRVMRWDDVLKMSGAVR